MLKRLKNKDRLWIIIDLALFEKNVKIRLGMSLLLVIISEA